MPPLPGFQKLISLNVWEFIHPKPATVGYKGLEPLLSPPRGTSMFRDFTLVKTSSYLVAYSVCMKFLFGKQVASSEGKFTYKRSRVKHELYKITYANNDQVRLEEKQSVNVHGPVLMCAGYMLCNVQSRGIMRETQVGFETTMWPFFKTLRTCRYSYRHRQYRHIGTFFSISAYRLSANNRHIGNHQYRRIGISAKIQYRHVLTKHAWYGIGDRPY